MVGTTSNPLPRAIAARESTFRGSEGDLVLDGSPGAETAAGLRTRRECREKPSYFEGGRNLAPVESRVYPQKRRNCPGVLEDPEATGSRGPGREGIGLVRKNSRLLGLSNPERGVTSRRVSDGASDPEVHRALSRVLAPLVEADQGELYWVRTPASSVEIHLHLGGRFSGCPGNALVTSHVIRPLVAAADPSRRVHVTSGAILPPGAERILPVGD